MCMQARALKARCRMEEYLGKVPYARYLSNQTKELIDSSHIIITISITESSVLYLVVYLKYLIMMISCSAFAL